MIVTPVVDDQWMFVLWYKINRLSSHELIKQQQRWFEAGIFKTLKYTKCFSLQLNSSGMLCDLQQVTATDWTSNQTAIIFNI